MWKNFSTSIGLLIIAMIAALYSSNATRDGRMIASGSGCRPRGNGFYTSSGGDYEVRLEMRREIGAQIALLKSRGYDVDYAPGVVLAQVAAIVSDGGWLQGASDGRSAAGKAAGY